MRRIVMFLLSSFLSPATLAAGQTTCLLATQIQIITPLPAADTAGMTVLSNSSGSCLARAIDAPLRPAVSRQMTEPSAKKRLNTAGLVEILLARLGWTDSGNGIASTVSRRARTSFGRAQVSEVATSFDPRLTYVAPERADNAVLRF